MAAKGGTMKMPSQAKAYIAVVVTLGTLVLLFAAGSWSSINLKQFVLYLGLTALASALKVRIPRMQGTISPNFVFILLGIVALPLSQVVALSLAAALVQCLWASAKRPRLVQVAFSAAALMVSSALAYEFSHIILTGGAANFPVVCVVLAGSIYFPLNSGLVSMVIGLVEGQTFKQVGQRCYEWAFPYFMGGIAFAGLVSGVFVPSTLWKGALVLLPAAVLAYIYFHSHAARATSATTAASSCEEECAVEALS
jgi:hypothetical protein